MYGGVSSDVMFGGEGDDIMYGGDDPTSLESNKIFVENGIMIGDYLSGEGGNDIIYGGNGCVIFQAETMTTNYMAMMETTVYTEEMEKMKYTAITVMM